MLRIGLDIGGTKTELVALDAGSGIVLEGRIVAGANGIGGEWGHNPLPWMEPAEYPGPDCYCGHKGCIERFVSGPALAVVCRTLPPCARTCRGFWRGTCTPIPSTQRLCGPRTETRAARAARPSSGRPVPRADKVSATI